MHRDLRAATAHLAANHLPGVFHATLHGCGHRRAHHDAARTGRQVNVEGGLFRNFEISVARPGLHAPVAGRRSVDAKVAAAGAWRRPPSTPRTSMLPDPVSTWTSPLPTSSRRRSPLPHAHRAGHQHRVPRYSRNPYARAGRRRDRSSGHRPSPSRDQRPPSCLRWSGPRSLSSLAPWYRVGL